MMYKDNERSLLGALVERIIPASETHGVPGAGDETILTDILGVAAPHHGAICGALAILEALAKEAGGIGFTNLSDSDQAATVEAFRAAQPELAGLIAALTAQCYYRDDRVMRALDMETRPPFPKGFEVAGGDWALLDPVRTREAFFRKV